MLLSEQSVLEVVQQLLGTRAMLRCWYVRTETYAVASVATHDRYAVKLEVPSAPRNRRFEVMSTLNDMVRAQTTVPVADVVAVDTSRRRWPWNVLIATELAGTTWAELYPRLDEVQRAAAQRKLGEAAARLHTVMFDGYGEVSADGRVMQPREALAALVERSQRRLRTPAYCDYFREVLDVRADVFAAAPGPSLCHEDLNPYNVLFEMHHGEPVLTGVLDFEAAWAGFCESDLARLELWRWTRGAAVSRNPQLTV
jgi:Ser/Thr protein kinase RdoA (MazF antagonist)